MDPKVVAVMPAYNEEKRIRKTIQKARKYVDKIIVVNDGSKDKTAEVSKKNGAYVISYYQNRGVGFASRYGLQKAISMRSGIIIFLDADGQLNPKYIPDFLRKIKEGCDYVYGLRDLSSYPFSRKIGNFGLTILTNLICPTGIRDTECGFRALTLKAAKKLNLKADRYEREVDFAYEVHRNRLKVGCVKIKVNVFFPKAAIRRGFGNYFFLIKRILNLV